VGLRARGGGEFDKDTNIFDVMANTDSYIESDRRAKRPVFGYPEWKRHRNSERFTRNLGNLFNSQTIRANWQEVLLCTLVAVSVVLWNDDPMGVLPKDHAIVSLPALPFTISGTFLSLLLVFRTNSAYGRWWEARCIWGAIINTCRDIVRQALCRFDPADLELKAEVTRLVSAYPRSLIYHLGERTDVSNTVIEKKYRAILTDEETEKLLACTHKPMTVTGMLSQSIRKAKLDVIDEMKIDADVTKFSDYYGMCERIFKTPMPLSYTRLTSRFLSVWLLTMPLALYGAIAPHWAIVPITFFLAFAIFGIEELGIQIEEPFSVLPMNVMANGIDASIFEALELDKEQRQKEGVVAKEVVKA
jgi:predicted membrane chloride channel (bestrophin family)